MAKLSVAIPVHNEAHRLEACLRALDFADEIVIVLDNCSDNSKEIAEQFTVHIVEGNWPLEGPRRMAAIAACSGDWILELDADEYVTPALAAEIRYVVDHTDCGYFTIPFDNYINDRLVKRGWGCSWGINAKNCLFYRDCKQWGDQRVHPKITLKGPAQCLTHTITHYIFTGVSDMLNRFNRYTTLRAADMLDHPPENETLKRNIRRVLSRFYKCYCRRRGFREGVYGFLNALFAGLYPLISYLKYEELLKQKHHQIT